MATFTERRASLDAIARSISREIAKNNTSVAAFTETETALTALQTTYASLGTEINDDATQPDWLGSHFWAADVTPPPPTCAEQLEEALHRIDELEKQLQGCACDPCECEDCTCGMTTLNE